MTDLFKTIATVVIHTPIWVWVLYALLLFLGFQRTRDSTVSLLRVLILPLVVTGLAISSFIIAGPNALPGMLLGLAVGGTAGWLLEPQDATRRLADGRVWLRGEWWSLVQIVVVLAFPLRHQHHPHFRARAQRQSSLAREQPVLLRSSVGTVPRPHRGAAEGVLWDPTGCVGPTAWTIHRRADRIPRGYGGWC